MARDRLSRLADTPRSLVKTLEEKRLPPRMSRADLMQHLGSMSEAISDLLDLGSVADQNRVPGSSMAFSRFEDGSAGSACRSRSIVKS